MIRFEDVAKTTIDLANIIQTQYFPELANVKIKYLLDTKKSTVNGKIALGKCRKTDDLIKYFTINETKDDEGYQYVITLDKIAYDNISDIDRTRLIRHELRHVLILEKEDKTIYKIYPHNIEDFVEEIELNKDDPRWALRVATLVDDIYTQFEEKENYQ